jgi:hypothetical protein
MVRRDSKLVSDLGAGGLLAWAARWSSKNLIYSRTAVNAAVMTGSVAGGAAPGPVVIGEPR